MFQMRTTCFTSKLRLFSTHSQSNILIDRQLRQAQGDCEMLLSLYERNRTKLNDRNWATLMNRLKNVPVPDRIQLKNHPKFASALHHLEHELASGTRYFSPQAFSNILHALAKLRMRHEPILELVDPHAEWLMNNGSVQAVVNTAWGLATLDFPAPKLFQLLDERALFLMENGKTQEIGNALWSCARLGYQSPNLFDNLDQHAYKLVRGGLPQEISNAAWACATLGHASPNFLQAVDNEASARIVNQGKLQEIANTAWACAVLKFAAPTLFGLIEQHSTGLIRRASAQEIANILWACATLGHASKNLFEKMDQLSHEKFRKMLTRGITQEISNTAWSCATLGHKAPTFFNLIDECAPGIKPNRNRQQVSNTAWSFATVKHKASNNFFRWIDENAAQLLSVTNPQGMANFSWSAATLGHCLPTLFRLLDEEYAEQLVRNGKSQEIGNAVWAFATLMAPASHLCWWIDQYAAGFLKTATPQTASNTVWAMYKLQYDCPKLLAGVDERSEFLIENGEPQAIANIALAMGELDFASQQFFKVLANRQDDFLSTCNNAQHACNCSYALALLDLRESTQVELLQRLWTRAVELDATTQQLAFTELGQLAYVRIHASVNGISLTEISTNLDNRIAETSKFQSPDRKPAWEDEYSMLLSKFFPHEREVSPFPDRENHFLAIDMACREQRIAVELDGYGHFLKCVSKTGNTCVSRENGRTKSKRRILEKLGWKVVNVCFLDNREINRVAGDDKEAAETAKIEYLKGRLQQAGAIFEKEQS